MPTAYDKRQDAEGLWEVFDEDSEQVVTIDGLPLSGLDEEEANDALRRLRSAEISPDYSPESP